MRRPQSDDLTRADLSRLLVLTSAQSDGSGLFRRGNSGDSRESRIYIISDHLYHHQQVN